MVMESLERSVLGIDFFKIDLPSFRLGRDVGFLVNGVFSYYFPKAMKIYIFDFRE